MPSERRDSLDRGGPVVGLHNRIKHLMTAVERGEQGIGDLAAGGGSVVISHHVSLEQRGAPPRGSCCSYCSPDEVVFLTTRNTYEPHNVDDRKYFELNNFYDGARRAISDSSELKDQCW